MGTPVGYHPPEAGSSATGPHPASSETPQSTTAPCHGSFAITAPTGTGRSTRMPERGECCATVAGKAPSKTITASIVGMCVQLTKPKPKHPRIHRWPKTKYNVLGGREGARARAGDYVATCNTSRTAAKFEHHRTTARPHDRTTARLTFPAFGDDGSAAHDNELRRRGLAGWNPPKWAAKRVRSGPEAVADRQKQRDRAARG